MSPARLIGWSFTIIIGTIAVVGAAVGLAIVWALIEAVTR